MLDIKLIRENPAIVKENLAKRNSPECLQRLDDLIALDKVWRANSTKLNDLRHDRKQVTIEIATLKKACQNADVQFQKAVEVDQKIKAAEKEVCQQEAQIHNYLLTLPNLLDSTVPYGKESADNVTVKKCGEPPKFSFQVKNHIDLALALDQVDMERAGKVTGARFFYLKGDVARLGHGADEFCNG